MSLIYNPRQLALVTCRGMHVTLGKSVEKEDVLPITWHAPASSHPPMYAIFVNKSLMGAKVISESGCFVVNFISHALVEKHKDALMVSGEFSQKLATLGLHEAACEKLVDCFRLKEALGWLECEVVESKEVGDCILFLGRVLHSEMGNDAPRPFHVDGDAFTTTR